MKKNYIQPVTDIFHIHVKQLFLETSGVEIDSSKEADPEEDVLVKEENEFIWEEETPVSDNYWE